MRRQKTSAEFTSLLEGHDMPPALGLIAMLAPIGAMAIPAAAGIFATVGMVAQTASSVMTMLSPPQRQGSDDSYSKEDRERVRKEIAESKAIIATSGEVSGRIGRRVMAELYSSNRDWRPPTSTSTESAAPRGLLA